MAVDVEVFDDRVEIRFSGWDRVWCVSSGVTLRMADIESARVAAVAEVRPSVGLRMGGTYVPGRIMAGRYTVKERRGARQLWCVRKDPEVLVIDTRIERPARVVLQHPDRHNLAWWIGERIGPRTD